MFRALTRSLTHRRAHRALLSAEFQRWALTL